LVMMSSEMSTLFCSSAAIVVRTYAWRKFS